MALPPCTVIKSFGNSRFHSLVNSCTNSSGRVSNDKRTYCREYIHTPQVRVRVCVLVAKVIGQSQAKSMPAPRETRGICHVPRASTEHLTAKYIPFIGPMNSPAPWWDAPRLEIQWCHTHRWAGAVCASWAATDRPASRSRCRLSSDA